MIYGYYDIWFDKEIKKWCVCDWDGDPVGEPYDTKEEANQKRIEYNDRAEMMADFEYERQKEEGYYDI